MGMQTEPGLAAQVGALGELGYSQSHISRVTGIPRRTVYDILGGDAKYLQTPVSRKLRQEVKEHLQARQLKLADKCLDRVEETLDKASAYQAAGIYGLIRTHERVDAGEPTQITEVQNTGNLELLAAKLSEAVQLRTQAKAEEIDITPAKEQGLNTPTATKVQPHEG